MASVLLHLGPYTPCCAGKISLENESISLHRLYAALNINLNSCSTSPGHGSGAAHHLQTGDMAGLLLHHQQFGAVRLGLIICRCVLGPQACQWGSHCAYLPGRTAAGVSGPLLLLTPLLVKGPAVLPSAVPTRHLPDRTKEWGQSVSLLASSPEACLFASAVRTEGGD